MVVIMRKNLGEEEILCVEASSCFGDGYLYITSMSTIYEVNTMGIYLNFIPHEIIQSILPLGNSLFGTKRFNIAWSENGSSHSFEIRTKKHKQLQVVLEKLSLNA